MNIELERLRGLKKMKLGIVVPPKVTRAMAHFWCFKMAERHPHTGEQTGRNKRRKQLYRAYHRMWRAWERKQLLGIVRLLLSGERNGETVDQIIDQDV